MLWVPWQLVFLVWALWSASIWNLSITDFVLFATSVGFVTGILGINISHELIHKFGIEVYLGKVLLATVCYGHWFTEHLWGHHKEVSTPNDPATARFGESFYMFWPRSVIGSFRSAWAIEKQRAKQGNYNLWSLQNTTVEIGITSVIIILSTLFVFGLKAVLFFLIQSVVAFSLLEIVNYIEHYGLVRKPKQSSDGMITYEAVTPLHSWNANARITNYFLFKLQRHSDHHANASRRYQILRSFEESPQMPTGYGGMLLLALFPYLWFYVMDKRVKDNQHKLAGKNLS
eukprot:TRINITY_DN1360_c0_g1_i6.p1 TRINITY_DN1360_c0_g1~~TRINITY_DN1360_c0_g1_i6.p1  ORF type:complete len:287 (+),score=43.57 TRINITY_DN1360_c0_g1_i6:616-1476(+)